MFQTAAVEPMVILQLFLLQNNSYIPQRMDGYCKTELKSHEFYLQHKNLSLHKLKIIYLVCVMINKSTVGIKCLPKDEVFGHVSFCHASCANCKGYSPWPTPLPVISPSPEINTCPGLRAQPLPRAFQHLSSRNSCTKRKQYWKLAWTTETLHNVDPRSGCAPHLEHCCAGAACEQLDGDFSVSGSWRGNVIISRTQNPTSFSDITECHGFASTDTAPYRQAPNLLRLCISFESP